MGLSFSCFSQHTFHIDTKNNKLLGEYWARCPCVASIVQADGAVLQQDNEILF